MQLKFNRSAGNPIRDFTCSVILTSSSDKESRMDSNDVYKVKVEMVR